MSEDATLDEFVQEKSEENSGSEWDELKLEDLLSELLTGGRPTGGGLDEGEYISIGGTQVNSEGYIDFHDLVYIPEDYFERVKETQLQKHDILVVKDGANTGDVAIAWESDDRIVTNEHLFTLRADSSINSPYLFYFLLSHRGWKQINGTITGSAQEGINRGFTGKVDVQYPQLSEQRKIATVLYTVDRAIEKTEEIIEQTEKIGRGLRQSLFTEGYYEHETEQYGTLGEVPVSWEKTRLYKIADVARGKFTHRPRNDPEFYDGEYPFIQTGEVVEAVGELTDFSQTLNEKGRGVSKEFAPGTIIITIAGNIGDTAVAAFPVYVPDSLVGITPDEETDERFLEHFLRYRQAFLNRLSTKTTQKNLNLTLLRPIEVVKPPLDEQKEIADTLSTVDDQIKKEKEYKNHLQRLKRGLMQDLLSGTVRTTDTNIEVPEEIAKYG